MRLDVNEVVNERGWVSDRLRLDGWKGAVAMRHASDAIRYIYLSLEVSKGGVLCEKM